VKTEGKRKYNFIETIKNKSILTGSFEISSYKWKVKGNNEIINSLAFSRDGNTLASASETTIQLWDCSQEKASFSDNNLGHHPSNEECMCQKQKECPVDGHSDQVLCVVFSPNKNILASASSDNTIKIWDTSSNALNLKQTLTYHSRPVNAVAFSPDGNKLASASSDRKVVLWDVSDKEVKLNYVMPGIALDETCTLCYGREGFKRHPNCPIKGHHEVVDYLAFSYDNQTLALGSRNGEIIIWDLSDGSNPRLIWTRQVHKSQVFSVAFSPTARILTTCGDDYDDDMKWTFTLWSLENEIPLLKNQGWEIDRILSATFSANGKRLVFIMEKRVIRTILVDDPENFETSFRIVGGFLNCIAFSPTPKYLAIGDMDGNINVYKVTDSDLDTLYI